MGDWFQRCKIGVNVLSMGQRLNCKTPFVWCCVYIFLFTAGKVKIILFNVFALFILFFSP